MEPGRTTAGAGGADLPGVDRYELLVVATVAAGQAWGLCAPSSGWALGRAPDGANALALWPSPEAAQDCAIGLWHASSPSAISIDDLQRVWVPALEQDGELIAAFHTPVRDAWHVAPAQFAEDLGALLGLGRR